MSNNKSIAALSVYKKVAIVRKSSDTLTYEDSDGKTKTISDLARAVSSAVSLMLYHCLIGYHFSNLAFSL